MNTVPEYLALDQLPYAPVERGVLDSAAKQIRDKDQSLIDLKFCVEALKHVRKISHKQKQGSVTLNVKPSTNPVNATSTTVSPINRATWTIDGHDLVDVAQRAFNALSTLVPSALGP
jgi:hypothetical protein